MEGSEGIGGGEELQLQPQPSQEDESGPSSRDEGHSEPGMHPTVSDSQNSIPEGCEDVGSTPEQVTGDHASDCDNSWEIVCSEPEQRWIPTGSGQGKIREREQPLARILAAALPFLELSPADPLVGDGDDRGGQATESLSRHEVGA